MLKYNVLIVEDNQIGQKIAKLIFESLECHADITMDFKSTIALLHKNTYDLIVMDIGLANGESGLTLTKEIKRKNLHRGCPIITLTAHASRREQLEAVAAGIDYFYNKPITKEIAKSMLDLCK